MLASITAFQDYYLQCNGKEISWSHLVELYEKDKGNASGLTVIPKIKMEHNNLTSFSKMRARLSCSGMFMHMSSL